MSVGHARLARRFNGGRRAAPTPFRYADASGMGRLGWGRCSEWALLGIGHGTPSTPDRWERAAGDLNPRLVRPTPPGLYGPRLIMSCVRRTRSTSPAFKNAGRHAAPRTVPMREGGQMPFWRTYSHLIWATKHRQSCITPERERL